MARQQRSLRFKAVLAQFMERAEVGDTELGRRLGVARLTVRRWRYGESLPNKETIRKLKSELRWVDSAGVLHVLTEPEVNQLLVAAGHHQAPMSQQVDRITPTDRCVVYNHRYSPTAFRSKWSNRIIELERLVPGSIYTMWSTLPSITRSPDFYVGGYERGLYSGAEVEAYMAEQRPLLQLCQRRTDCGA